MNRIDEIRTQIQNYEMDIQDIQNKINALKLELADIVLNEPHKAETTERATNDWNEESRAMVVSVKFNDNGKTYDYLWNSEDEVNIGDMVEVENRWVGTQEVEVVDVFTQDWNETKAHTYAYPID